ncbi:hypothetical protein ACFVMC_32835 [Nocardia sp. NPDC127579]|uniref:hypothetical protein n=1 Tax=Nocardia sp. NPDC127579 TaxID=3345402 RepID=UPI00363047C5
MRRERLHQLVTDLVTTTWTGDNADVATAIVSDDAFGALCFRLHETGSDAAGIERRWAALVETAVDERTRDWLAERAENPAAWLAHQLSTQTTG